MKGSVALQDIGRMLMEPGHAVNLRRRLDDPVDAAHNASYGVGVGEIALDKLYIIGRAFPTVAHEVIDATNGMAPLKEPGHDGAHQRAANPGNQNPHCLPRFPYRICGRPRAKHSKGQTRTLQTAADRTVAERPPA